MDEGENIIPSSSIIMPQNETDTESKIVEIPILYREILDEDNEKFNITEAKIRLPNVNQVKSLIKLVSEDVNALDIELSKDFSKYENVEYILTGPDKNWRMKMIKSVFKDFIDNGLYGRSKQRTKLLIAFDLTHLGYGLLLIQTTKSGKELKLKPVSDGTFLLVEDERFIDEDTIYRFVYFYLDEEGTVRVKAHEESFSEYFTSWLKIDDPALIFDVSKELNLAFYCEHSGLKVQFSINEQDYYSSIDNPRSQISFDKQNNYLLFRVNAKQPPLRFKIVNIRVRGLKKNFKNLSELDSYLKRRRYNIDIIIEKYFKFISQLKKQFDLSQMQLSKTGLIVEDKSTVTFTSLGKRINKNLISLPWSNVEVIVSDSPHTQYSLEFLQFFASILYNGGKIRIMTPHLEYPLNENDAIEIGPVVLYNYFSPSQTLEELCKVYETEEIYFNPTLRNIVTLVILDMLSNEIKPLKYFFRQLAEYYSGNTITGLITSHEGTIEYKRPDILYGSTYEAVKRLVSDIPRKLRLRSLVVYCIGIDEKTRKIFTIDNGECGEDCANQILDEVRQRLKSMNIEVSTHYPIPAKGISSKGDLEDGYILVFYARKIREDENAFISAFTQMFT